MNHLLESPAFWGFCGGMLAGLVGLIPAVASRTGTPEARRKALLQLVIGLVAGPTVGHTLATSLAEAVRVLDPKGMAVILGWFVANDPRGFFGWMTRMVKAAAKEAFNLTEKTDDRT